jgi:hypothetical protein
MVLVLPGIGLLLFLILNMRRLLGPDTDPVAVGLAVSAGLVLS